MILNIRALDGKHIHIYQSYTRNNNKARGFNNNKILPMHEKLWPDKSRSLDSHACGATRMPGEIGKYRRKVSPSTRGFEGMSILSNMLQYLLNLRHELAPMLSG
jgi:hypothetical protein